MIEQTQFSHNEIQEDYRELTFKIVDELQNINGGQDFTYIHRIIYNVLDYFYGPDEKQFTINMNAECRIQDFIALGQGAQHVFQRLPTPVHFISVYLLYNHQEDQGRLVQIYNSEDKTMIVSMLAVLLVIKKQSIVNIITSSPTVAKQYSTELKKFYEYFSLTVSHNIVEDFFQQSKSFFGNIIYGDPLSFEVRYLRSQQENVEAAYAILDDMETIIINDMLDITGILRLIWQEINKIIYQIENDDIKNGNNYQINFPFNDELQEQIKNSLDFLINEEIKKFQRPCYLNFIKKMKTTWIYTAFQAMVALKENDNYVIQSGKVTKVENLDGKVDDEEILLWQQGIHQFLQLKHNLDVTPLIVNLNILQNDWFFQRYHHKVLGIAASQPQITKNFLEKYCRMDYFYIPPYLPPKLKELQTYTFTKMNDWLQCILKEVQEHICSNRAVILINKNLENLKSIGNLFIDKKIDFTLYRNFSEKIQKVLIEKQVVATTKLAVSSYLIPNDVIESNGGLHVLVTFLPRNIKIKEQAFGKNVCFGRKGTCRLIICQSEQECIRFFLINKILNSELYLLNFFQSCEHQIQVNKFSYQIANKESKNNCYNFGLSFPILLDSHQIDSSLQLKYQWFNYFRQNKESEKEGKHKLNNYLLQTKVDKSTLQKKILQEVSDYKEQSSYFSDILHNLKLNEEADSKLITGTQSQFNFASLSNDNEFEISTSLPEDIAKIEKQASHSNLYQNLKYEKDVDFKQPSANSKRLESLNAIESPKSENRKFCLNNKQKQYSNDGKIQDYPYPLGKFKQTMQGMR